MRELDGIRFMWQQQERQYEITSDTIENINRKCHDLKYQIHNLSDITDETEKREYLQELERDIMIYDVSLQTGNRALDVVLMEKGLFCKNHEIQWSCMVDGSRMNFMKAEDIYGIFGNALDNAIEAVSRLRIRAACDQCESDISEENTGYSVSKLLSGRSGIPEWDSPNERSRINRIMAMA